MVDSSPDYFLKTLEKGLKILNLFDEDQPSWSLKELTEAMQMNKTSAYRFINTFVEMDYLIKDETTKQISLGPMSIALGHRLLRASDLHQIVAPIIETACRKYNLSIDVSTFVHNAMVLVCRSEQQNTLTFHQPVSVQELYCTAIGKAVLAHLPAPEFDQNIDLQSFHARTENTITDRSQLLAHLAEVRNNGYSLNDEEYIRGLISIGAPIFNPVTGQVMGGIAFDSTTVETSLTSLVDTYVSILKELATRISAMISVT